jgi:tetrahydrodipicolinate N-succinyltransferase
LLEPLVAAVAAGFAAGVAWVVAAGAALVGAVVGAGALVDAGAAVGAGDVPVEAGAEEHAASADAAMAAPINPRKRRRPTAVDLNISSCSLQPSRSMAFR